MKALGAILTATWFVCSPLHAQLVNDGATNTLANVTTNIAGSITVGTNGSFTLLVLSNNCLLSNSGLAIIGFDPAARSNEVRLVSPTARWSLNNALFVGSGGSANRLVVSNGGLVENISGVIGGGAFTASNNAVLVTGAGSTWSNSNTLRVGDVGPGNQLVVSNGGTVFTGTNLTVGVNTTFSLNNRVTVEGGTLRVTNVAGTAVYNVRRGTNVINAGLIEVDQLLVTNAAGLFEFNGGTLAVRNGTSGSGVGLGLRVGNGTNTAMFRLAGNGTNIVAGICTISSNAVLAGNGRLVGALTVQAGGTVSPGTSIGKISLSVTPTLQGIVFMEISKNGAALTNDQIEIVGPAPSFNYGGTLVVSKLGPTALANGDSFPLFSASSHSGAFSTVVLPPLGAGLGWELDGAGSLVVTAAAPVVVTLAASSVAGTNATLNATASPHGFNTSGWFEYGTTTNYGTVTAVQALGGGVSPADFAQAISGLAGRTLYHFRAVVSNSFGVALGADQSFQTLGPEARTLPAFGLIANPALGNTATLRGQFNAHGDQTVAWFEWGTTTNYGNRTLPAAASTNSFFVDVVEGLSGLSVGVLYHFRCVASNARAVVTGDDMTFIISFDQAGVGLTGAFDGTLAWGDFNNDGRLDLLQTGSTNLTISPMLQIWRNTGAGFVGINPAIPPIGFSKSAWGDYDNDGLLDLVLTGNRGRSISNIAVQVWRNTGAGFVSVDARMPGVQIGDAAWGDYDGDGRLDLLLAGADFTFTNQLTELWRNTGSGFAKIDLPLPGVRDAAVAWGDYDNDGRLDFFLTGATNNTSSGISQLWHNTGSGFTNVDAGFPGVLRGSVAWGDYDNDGLLDLLLTGFDLNEGQIAQVWRNTGQGFTNIQAGLPGISNGSGVWGDYDNDGRLDILLSGSADGRAVLEVWRNTVTGFTNSNQVFPAAGGSSVAWGDFDQDGRLDFVIMGSAGNGFLSQVWRNETPATNTPPAAPTGLGVTLASNAVVFHWNPGVDPQTPAAGLTHNLRIGTTPGGSEILAPMAARDGFRRLPAMGNAQHNRSFAMSSLPFGQPIYWSVQSIDTSFAGSAFAPEQTFTFSTVFTPPNGQPVGGDANGDGAVNAEEFAEVLSHLNGNGVASQLNLDQLLTNFLPNSPFLQMTNVAGLGGSNVTFALTNDLSGAFSVEYTTNFADWLFLGPATPRYEFDDTNAPAAPRRFYRLRWP